MGKRTKKHLYKLSPIEVYNLVLEGKLRTFPNGYWKGDFGMDNARKCIKYLLEEKLKFTDDDIRKNFKCAFFHKYKLWGLLQKCFDASPYKALEFTYPGRFKEWEISVPLNFWNTENGIIAVKWLFEEKLKLKEDEIAAFAIGKIFCKYGLSSMLVRCFDSSPYKALDAAYPGKYKVWEVPSCPKKFWTEKTGGEATRWLLEEKLKLSKDDIPRKVSTKLFQDNGLGGMLTFLYKGSVFRAINSAYPNKYKEWELNRVPSNFWTNEKAIEATKWLVEDRLKLSKEDISKMLLKDHFIKNGLNGMLVVVYNGSFKRAVQSAYPGII